MAYDSTDTTFIHVPKAAGQLVLKYLAQLGPVRRNGHGHGLPDYWEPGRIHWCVVRDPAEWLASAWAWRVKLNWDPFPEPVPWQHFCKLTDRFATDDFSEFVDSIVEYLPGIVTWVYVQYTPPPVTPIILPHLNDWLRELGCNPDEVDRYNVNDESPNNLGTLTQELRQKIYEAEYLAHTRWRMASQVVK